MIRSLHFEQSGLEVKLHNLQLQLEDIEDAIGKIKSQVLQILNDPEPATCDGCGLVVSIREAIRAEWQDLREVGEDLFGICTGCVVIAESEHVSELVVCHDCPESVT